MTQDEAVQSALLKNYFTATIEVRRKVTEKDADGDPRSLGPHTVAEIPARIVRAKDPIEVVEAERVVSVKNWEIRLHRATLERLEKEKGCFRIMASDILRDKKSKIVYQNQGNDKGRTEEQYLSVYCVQVG